MRAKIESEEGQPRRGWIVAVVIVLVVALCCCGTLAVAWFTGDAVLEVLGVYP